MGLNLSALCIVDSNKKEQYEILQETIWAPLAHFGIPHTAFDMTSGNDLNDPLLSCAVIIFAQENVLSSLSPENGMSITKAIAAGTGLISFDPDIHHLPESLKYAFGLRTTEEQTHMHVGFFDMPESTTQAVRTIDNEHYITYTREIEFTHFNKPVRVGNIVEIGTDARVLMVHANSSGCPALVVTSFEKGRAVLFTFSTTVWLKEYFGHGGGLTDVFWKSIAWAARKPFTMFAMPPFATMRVDDCSGTNDRFRWIDTVNRHGIIPHCSLFMENISRTGSLALKRKYDEGLAEFSAHAFTWNRVFYWKPESPEDHTRGEPLPDHELRDAFQKIDAKFSEWGIKPSRVFLPHFGEVGQNVLPFLKERGIIFFGLQMRINVPFNYVVGGTNRELMPYFGQGGTLDKHPEDPDFFVAESDYTTLPKAEIDLKVAKDEIKEPYQMYDFLWDWGRVEVDIEAAARHASNQLKLGLDNLIFGQINTHEQNIYVLSLAEWENLMTRIEEMTERYKIMWKNWEYIASYAADRHETRIISVEYDTATRDITCNFQGRSKQTLYIYVFRDKGECIEYSLHPVPDFEDSISLVIRE
ncbi:MAG TPA: hypothetical protein ENI15_17460 [Spirochaetes bacterium]|nr:hypothetical protein [Spirochaetota bacterium]